MLKFEKNQVEKIKCGLVGWMKRSDEQIKKTNTCV